MSDYIVNAIKKVLSVRIYLPKKTWDFKGGSQLKKKHPVYISQFYLVKYSEVEVIVVVSNGNVTTGSHPDTNGEVGDTLTTDLSQVVALIVEHLDTVRPVVADEHLLVVIHRHTIREFKMPEA